MAPNAREGEMKRKKYNLFLSLFFCSKGWLNKTETLHFITSLGVLIKDIKRNKTLSFLIQLHFSPSDGLLPSALCKCWSGRIVGLTGSKNQQVWKGQCEVSDGETQGRGCRAGAIVPGNDFIKLLGKSLDLRGRRGVRKSTEWRETKRWSEPWTGHHT